MGDGGEHMKLWLIQRSNDGGRWDVLNGALVRAKTEQEARLLVAEDHGDEGYDVWLKESTTCVPVYARGKAGILLTDFTNG
jgi:hypothetical protein